ncbi:BRO-N domain-containing protein [Halomonas sp. 86]|uniref:BRO-N domain-containing protein n=1 Tax=unclassified Halomonas TaxID=2609666 RepID=UPI00403375FD
MQNVKPFNFEKNQVRVIQDDNGEPLFVAKDVALALGYRWAGSATVSHVPDEWKGVNSVQTPMGEQRLTVLTEQGLYFFTARSDKPKALPFQKWLAGDVLPSIRKTGSYQPEASQASIPATMALCELAITVLRPSDSSKIVMLQKAGKATGADTSFLPDYTEDSAPGHVGAMDTASATHLLREYGVSSSAIAFNERLYQIGLMERRERKSTGGKIKHFWCITDEGLAYGKNIVSPQSPRETQPHWFREKFAELLALVGLEVAA